MKNNTSEYIYPSKLPNYAINNDRYTNVYVIENTDIPPVWDIKVVYSNYLNHYVYEK